MERKKSKAAEEVRQTVATEEDEEERKQSTRDQEMVDESAEAVRLQPSPVSAKSAAEAGRGTGQGNVEMIEEEAVDLKQDEKALLDNSASLNSGGTLLKVSGQSTLDNTRSVGTSHQSVPADKPVDLNDIVVEKKEEASSPAQLSGEEKGIPAQEEGAELKEDEKLLIEEKEETNEEFITNVFIKPLLGRVFKFIDEKKALESKRKTWNLKHQEKEVSKARQQRTQWEYHN